VVGPDEPADSGRRMTIAERRAAEKAAASSSGAEGKDS
jgi:hypothetical protein